MTQARVFLWYDGAAQEAADFYAATFADCEVTSRGGMAVEFTLGGLACVGLNGGPMFQHTPAFSFHISTENQAETDRLWAALTGHGGEEGRCGWCKDRWGISWQIIPRALSEGLSDPERAVRDRVVAAMMGMGRIDIAAIEAARKGDG